MDCTVDETLLKRDWIDLKKLMKMQNSNINRLKI